LSSQENKATFLHLFEQVFQKHTPDAFLEFFAPDVVFHLSGLPQPLHGREAVKEWAAHYLSAWDAQFTIQEEIAEGQTVAARWTVRAFHRREYLGMPPTGTTVNFTELCIVHLAEGKAVEVWVMFDTLSVVQQMGFFPKSQPPRNLLRFVIWLRGLGRSRKEKPAAS
jgi:hypothetical protein